MDRSEANSHSPDPARQTQRYAPDEQLHVVSQMLGGLDEAASTAAARTNEPHENRLIQVRLGVASSLFHALRAKHPASAAHSMRVALGCSAWGLTMNLTDQQRDEIEMAALLHDIGKIGVPDHVLLKPAALETDEVELMQRHHEMGLQILSSCCASQTVLDIIRYAPAWYGGSEGFDRRTGDLPLGSRVLAIVDAFDSMTTDHVWRRAVSRERALAELFEYAGTQFDPELVREYCVLQSNDLARLHTRVARRWLRQLQPEQEDANWQLQSPCQRQSPGAASRASEATEMRFHRSMIEHMHDAVIFVDNSLRVLMWNHGAQRLTGISAASVIGQRWLPRLIEMLSDGGLVIADTDCPVVEAIRTGDQVLRRFTITGREGKELAVNCQIMPVASSSGMPQGAILLLHDLSSEATLKERIQSLNEQATQDPLTKVSNRAEFDRTLKKFAQRYLERSSPCALILCDIDHFKSVNDTYGHQAGDLVLVTFAKILKKSCRPGDLVSRYGGEEFALLCAECDNATATARAERIRIELASMCHDALGGKAITSSFGVTEVQPGDNPDTFLRRADRALYEAKEMGRNMVVQLGAGMAGSEPVEDDKRGWWQSWFSTERQPDVLLNTQLISTVPMKMVVEKLRGFVADQEAEISSIEENHVTLALDGPGMPLLRRTNDRAVPFVVELVFEEKTLVADGQRGTAIRTLIQVIVRPKRSRDRRRKDAVERARQVLRSLKSYLMAGDYAGDEQFQEGDQKGMLEKAKTLLGNWRNST